MRVTMKRGMNIGRQNMKFNLVKHNGNAIPATDSDMKKFGKVGEGEVFSCKTIDQRVLAHHRKFFAMINLAWNNMPEQFDNHFPTVDHLRKELIKRAGFYTEYTDFKGRKQYIPDSISFDKMSQSEFEDVYDRVLDVILKWLMPGTEKELFQHEIMNFL